MPATKKSGTKKATGGNGARKKGASAKSAKQSQTKNGKGLMKPMRPDEELSAIVGARPMPRTEITKKIWDYIKSHNLQDPNNRRMINADENLQPVFGGKKRVSMFEMARLVNQHIR